jgi:hypothetical protein
MPGTIFLVMNVTHARHVSMRRQTAIGLLPASLTSRTPSVAGHVPSLTANELRALPRRKDLVRDT